MIQPPKNYPVLDLTNDRNFKHFFSRDRDVLLSLLKAFLPLPEKKSIQSVEIISDKRAENTAEKEKQSTATKQSLNPTGYEKGKGATFGDFSAYKVDLKPEISNKTSITLKDSALYPSSIDGKQSILDLNIQLNTGERIDVEMQATNQPHFSKRVVFYWAKLHSTGLNKGEDYDQLYPTYSLVFTTFPVLEEELRPPSIAKGVPYVHSTPKGSEKSPVVRSFSIRLDEQPHPVLNHQLRMMFVDLSCFKKDIRQALDKKDQWCYFIKNAGRLSRDQLKLLSTKGEDMAKAVGLFDNVSARDLEWLRKRTEEREHWDRISMQAEARKKARREGHAEGKAEGHAEGKAEGMEKGMEKGMQKGREKGMEVVALNMLKEKADMSFICKVTGLSAQDIHKLKDDS